MSDNPENPSGQIPVDNKMLRSLMVDGKYTPSPQELVELIKKQNLQEALKDSQVVTQQDNKRLVLSLATSEQAHLLALALMAKGYERQLFYPSIDESFYDKGELEDYRIDGNQLTLQEQADAERVNATIQLKYKSDEERTQKLEDLVKDTLKEAMPHLTDQITKLQF
jgi:hypothetical protein